MADLTLDTTIDELDITVSTYNVLKAAGFKNVREITKLCAGDFSATDGMSNANFYEVASLLNENGVYFLLPPRPYMPTQIPDRYWQSRYSYVYLFQWLNYYKIGYSADVERRLRDIDKMPEPVTCLHKIKVYVFSVEKAEADLHRKYAQYRVRFEWFKLPPSTVAEICSLKDGDLDDRTRNHQR